MFITSLDMKYLHEKSYTLIFSELIIGLFHFFIKGTVGLQLSARL